MTDFAAVLRLLSEGKVETILIGGVAAIAHGSARLTQDVDVVYRRTPGNLDRLVAVLSPHHPYLRGAPPGLPFRWEAATIKNGLNFTLTTDLGPLDLLGEVTGGGRYEDLLPHTVELRPFGIVVRCITLEWLIRTKRAAGRPKDFEAIAELEALRDEQRDPGR